MASCKLKSIRRSASVNMTGPSSSSTISSSPSSLISPGILTQNDKTNSQDKGTSFNGLKTNSDRSIAFTFHSKSRTMSSSFKTVANTKAFPTNSKTTASSSNQQSTSKETMQDNGLQKSINGSSSVSRIKRNDSSRRRRCSLDVTSSSAKATPSSSSSSSSSSSPSSVSQHNKTNGWLSPEPKSILKNPQRRCSIAYGEMQSSGLDPAALAALYLSKLSSSSSSLMFEDGGNTDGNNSPMLRSSPIPSSHTMKQSLEQQKLGERSEEEILKKCHYRLDPSLSLLTPESTSPTPEQGISKKVTFNDNVQLLAKGAKGRRYSLPQLNQFNKS